jgi:hypothetical protein
MRYTCARCREEYESRWPDEAAQAEYEEMFGRPFDPSEAVLLCDDCYREALGRLTADPFH